MKPKSKKKRRTDKPPLRVTGRLAMPREILPWERDLFVKGSFRDPRRPTGSGPTKSRSGPALNQRKRWYRKSKPWSKDLVLSKIF